MTIKLTAVPFDETVACPHENAISCCAFPEKLLN